MENKKDVKAAAKGNKEKVKPVSPAKARLEKRANDEKIVRRIKMGFIAFVSLAVVCIIIGIVLFVYKPPVFAYPWLTGALDTNTRGGNKIERLIVFDPKAGGGLQVFAVK